jgi:hypothetical protein
MVFFFAQKPTPGLETTGTREYLERKRGMDAEHQCKERPAVMKQVRCETRSIMKNERDARRFR